MPLCIAANAKSQRGCLGLETTCGMGGGGCRRVHLEYTKQFCERVLHLLVWARVSRMKYF